MSKVKNISLKTASIIIIPLLIGIFTGYIVLLIGEDKTEITFKLDSWITVGSNLESELSDLSLIYKDIPVRNILKVSWKILNSGSKGIAEFESGPTILFPEGMIVTEARISEASPLLKYNKETYTDSTNRKIDISGLGVFNEGDYIKVDVYIVDLPDTLIASALFQEWDMIAKAVDLKVRKEIDFTSLEEKTVYDSTLKILVTLNLIFGLAFVTMVLLYIKGVKSLYTREIYRVLTDRDKFQQTLINKQKRNIRVHEQGDRSHRMPLSKRRRHTLENLLRNFD
ncbi:hypothetical protein CEE37_14650 [candidate division LCP-89 bacterium B3_LCP]|uniref:Uncharacterized protein n=1 Tax=candidate division LCP-89 bacterium B3_LCP TaxID=2012998 RepID=A0A532UPJ5_UNCL8|nr:MAG: hypothetical protein CEE37_14650 [candidate division LCP-89 bacterium B3_LCP]